MKVTSYKYGFETDLSAPSGGSFSPEALGEQVHALSQNVDDVLTRIENLKARR
jgi:hypothetical protein